MMGEVNVFKVSSSHLNVSEAVALPLQASSAGDKTSNFPPVAPKGGEIYIYQNKLDNQRGMLATNA